MSAKLVIEVGGFKSEGEAQRAIQMVEDGEIGVDDLVRFDDEDVSVEVEEED